MLDEKVRECVCNENRIQTIYLAIALTIGIAVLAVTLYFSSLHRNKSWIRTKKNLKRSTKKLATRASRELSQFVETDFPNESPPDRESLDRWIDSIYSYRVGKDKKGTLWMIDRNGTLWFRNRGGNIARGPYKINLEDNPYYEIFHAAKRGSSFFYYRGKNDQLMLAYATPIRGTNCIISMAVQVPKSRRVWQG
jgi:hypothetical protein